MNKTMLLDCTLRDGGYINDWKFGNSTITCIIDRLASANIDIIEVGFLDDRRRFDLDRTIQPDTDSYNSLLSNIEKKNAMIFAMIDFGTCSIDNISECRDSILDGIRVIFKKPKMHDAIAYAEKIIKKGYKVSLQLVSTTSYSDRDILDFVDLTNKIKPFAVSIVDTYGLMHNKETLHYFNLLDHNLDKEILLGYHSHNNFQLAYANTIEITNKKTSRKLLIDGTVYGMGKSAGNAPTELLAMYLNENFKGNYDLNQILEIVDTNIMSIYREKYWGYSFLYYLSASNDCHPNYISYLLEKKTLSVSNINEIINRIEDQFKLDYNREHIEYLYIQYQKRNTSSNKNTTDLLNVFKDQKVILLGPGNSVKDSYEDIKKHIDASPSIVVSINCIPDVYSVNYVFINNAKRYSLLLTQLKKQNSIKVITTSNILSTGIDFNYVINYESLLDKESVTPDNSLIMFLNLLQTAKARKILLAGFDGFYPSQTNNYYNDFLEMSFKPERLELTNQAISKKLSLYKNSMDVEFITDSLYSKIANITSKKE